MEKKIQHVLDEAQGVMDGLTAVLFYRLANITVEADPLSLLSTTVKVGDNERNIEDVATSSMLDKYSFAFVPKDNEYIGPLIKGLKREHPDFRLEQREQESSTTSVKLSEEEMEILGITRDEEEPERSMYLVCTMPEMNEERRDTYIDVSIATCETSKKQIDVKKGKFEAVLLKRAIGMPEDQIEEAKGELETICENAIKDCESSKETKLKSIEEAYQFYLSNQEQDAGFDDDGGSGMQMSMND
ncbi:MAG: hypothetical protein SNG35_00920 [Rikenellaceae bacterium]